MTQNYVFKKNAFRFWFLFFCATSILIVPIYYYGWEETAEEEGNLINFISGVNPMDIVSKVESSKVQNVFLGGVKADRRESGELNPLVDYKSCRP